MNGELKPETVIKHNPRSINANYPFSYTTEIQKQKQKRKIASVHGKLQSDQCEKVNFAKKTKTRTKTPVLALYAPN